MPLVAAGFLPLAEMAGVHVVDGLVERAVAAAAVPAPVVASGGGSEVPAPLLGTFYHAPKPGAAPFVKVGDTVTEDSVIGIIEVMKLMNQVTAGIAGTVTEIVAANGALVEHGQPLLRIQPA